MKNRLRDGEAFDRLVEEHYDDVLAYCRRHAPSYDDAPDVAQEAFLRFVRSGCSPADGKPLAYLFTIARNLCIDAARAKRTIGLVALAVVALVAIVAAYVVSVAETLVSAGFVEYVPLMAVLVGAVAGAVAALAACRYIA